MTGALFTIAPLIPAEGCPLSGHTITAEELLLVAKEAADQPCIVLAKHTKWNGNEKIEIQIAYKSLRPAPGV